MAGSFQEIGTPDRLFDLRYLRLAAAAREHGSFRRAAEMLGVHPTEVGRRIRLLEDRLGIELFERRRGGSRTTSAGETFLREAQFGVDQIARAAAIAALEKRAECGDLRIGILASLSTGFLRNVIEQFSKDYSGVRMMFQTGTPEEHVGSLLSGKIDVAFISGRPEVPGCNSEFLWLERIFVALPGNHLRASADEVKWSDLHNEHFLVTKRGPGPEIENHVIRRLAQPGFQPKITVHDICREDVMQLVAMGLGVTLTSESTMGIDIPGVVLRPVSDDELLPSSGVWLDSNNSPALKTLLGVARKLASSLA